MRAIEVFVKARYVRTSLQVGNRNYQVVVVEIYPGGAVVRVFILLGFVFAPGAIERVVRPLLVLALGHDATIDA